MSFCFDESLRYIAPSNGNWGLVRVLCLIPEAHIIFITPEGCGRHSSLGAIQHEQKHRTAYYFVNKEEITAGYDENIKEAIRELFERLGRKPPAVLAVVGCIDDLIGTDVDRIMEELEDEFKGIKFRCCHMNPINSDTDRPPIVTTEERQFSLLDVQDNKDEGVNLIGCFEKPDEDGDLYFFLKEIGIKYIRHISDFKTFEDFQNMAKSKLNILTEPHAKFACEEMKKKHGIDFVPVLTSYNMDVIKKNYKMIYDILDVKGLSFPNLDKFEKCAKDEIEKTLKVVGDREVWISDGSILKPFELAKSLIEYRFNVKKVVAQDIKKFDRESAKWLEENSSVEIIQSGHHSTPLFQNRNEEALCLGFNAAYIAGSDKVVPIMNDEFNYGFHGIIRLMRDMQRGVLEALNLRELIDEYGLVI